MGEIGFLVLHLLGAAGFSIIIAYGTPTAPLRRIWPAMMSCPTCFGVWGGFGWGIVFVLRPWLPMFVVRLHDVVAFACATSFFGYLSASILGAVMGLNRGPKPKSGGQRFLLRR